ncbi:MAG: ATP-binding protein [Thermoleophilia bacterium]
MSSRLTAAFVAVALMAVAVLGGLIWATTQSEVARLADAREAATTQDVVATLADAYAEASSWQPTDTRAAHVLAASAGATLVVLDENGEAVPFGRGMGATGGGSMMSGRITEADLGPAQETPVIVDGRQVGTAVLRFPLGASAAEEQIRSALGSTVLWGGLLAAGLAAVAGLLVARRIARPLHRLTDAAGALAAGDRSARAGSNEPAELGKLASAFDRMAATIETEDKLRRAFAADVAHELRTPLTIVQGELETLVDGIEPPTPERLASLHEETLRLARIVADVETLAAAEAAQFRLEHEPLDLADVAQEAIAALRGAADTGGIRLLAHLQSAAVVGDRARLGQIARNLIGNAVKFTPAAGQIDVTVKRQGGDALLIVEDTGPGFSDDEAPYLFERFWRGRSAEGADGSGVGLAVVAELARAHGGSVQATSRPEGGARFTVSLPRS